MTDHSSYVDFLEGDVITTDFKEMEEKGYYTINSNPNPSEQEVEAIENSVGKKELYGDFRSDTVPTKYFSWEQYRKEIRPGIKERWKKFMNFGINVALPLPLLPF